MKTKKVTVLPYDKAWKKDFEDIKKEIEEALEGVLKKNNIPYTSHAGEAAFYGPKIDIKLIDAIGRPWQLSTIQFDFNLPERFDLTYVAKEGRQRPLMVHRAMLGSIERLLGILIEHYGGLFPLWLAPLQAKILTLTDAQVPAAEALLSKMKQAGLRAELDASPEKLGAKIRAAHLEKVPYTLIIGAKEAETNTVTIRLRSGKNITVSQDELIKTMSEEANTRSLENLFK